MTAHTRTRTEAAPAFELKGSMLMLTVLHLRSADLPAVDAQLAEKVRQAPEFFRSVPLVLDLEAMAGAPDLDLAALADLLRRHNFVPVGVRNAAAEQQEAAIAAGLGVLPKSQGRAEQRAKTEPKAASAPTKAEPVPHAPPPSRLIDHPVRSGQQVYAQGGDLVVVAAVSPGAELLADGHIHVYGVLRGRALAGVRGDTSARIFCQGLEADLISVAGHYRVMEEIEPGLRDRPVQIYLEADRLKVQPL
jgi:septum site-determining protein MinC